MVIQHNISALNSHRNMGLNNAGTAKNLEKLSSGFRINRAGDDAAGLAISEKMRGQIRGLAMAEQNTANGVSLIQTAEGGLNETHAILQRMRELAVQSSNGTYQEEDRNQITEEFEALKSEIDRIAESTHYNGIKLLNGNLSKDKAASVTTDSAGIITSAKISLASTAEAGDVLTLNIAGLVAGTKSTVVVDPATINDPFVAGDTVSFDFNNKTYTTAGLKAGATAAELGSAMAAAIIADKNYANEDFTVAADAAGKLTFTAKTAGAGTIDAYTIANVAVNSTSATPGSFTTAPALGTGITGTNPTLTTPTIQNGTAAAEALTAVFDSKTNTFALTNANGTISLTVDASKIPTTGMGATLTVSQGDNLVFQIGANGGDDQRVNLSVNNMDSKHIGYRVGDILSDGTIATDSAMLNTSGVDTVANANKAIDIITGATNMVSTQRAQLGALQNRLEHTLNNLGVTKENLTAAESSIRDVDMAKEMMDFTKNNILVQASQAMLAQANQLPQGVLQLLR